MVGLFLCGCSTSGYDKDNYRFVNGVEIRERDTKTLEMRIRSYDGRFPPMRSPRDKYEPKAPMLTHPCAPAAVAMGNTGKTVITRQEISKSREGQGFYDEYDYCKAVWAFNDNMDSHPLTQFAESHNKSIVMFTNNDFGKIRPGTVFGWKCMECGLLGHGVYMEITTNQVVSFPGLSKLIQPCPGCGK